MVSQNLFALEPERQGEYLQRWAELIGVGEAWETLASVRDRVEPHYGAVARRIAERLQAHPFTQEVEGIAPIFMAVMPYYFDAPRLDGAYLENRARAGRAYLEAGFTASTLAAKYALFVEEWCRVFEALFPEELAWRLELERALVKVALFNYAVALEQFSYEREEKFLRAAGISRALLEQMAKVAE
ncbi:MAG: hypothetical protein RMI80_10280 [Meiothermus sp.]|uniref:hypothetical protein n=1 Tax=Meiothermus sp. TaxID=1955249 RepID=UPI00298F305F|nr:hypothetical protein [Meiothermus sp.]MDW8091785.1 hypothetical protein [Meiothermus sp.]